MCWVRVLWLPWGLPGMSRKYGLCRSGEGGQAPVQSVGEGGRLSAKTPPQPRSVFLLQSQPADVLCGPGQVTWHLCASASSTVKCCGQSGLQLGGLNKKDHMESVQNSIGTWDSSRYVVLLLLLWLFCSRSEAFPRRNKGGTCSPSVPEAGASMGLWFGVGWGGDSHVLVLGRSP